MQEKPTTFEKENPYTNHKCYNIKGKTNIDQGRNKNLNGKVQNHKKLSPPPSPDF
jgi:hypothetical protein